MNREAKRPIGVATKLTSARMQSTRHVMSFKTEPNGRAERPTAANGYAPCAHNSPGVHGAPYQLSRLLQATERERKNGTEHIEAF